MTNTGDNDARMLENDDNPTNDDKIKTSREYPFSIPCLVPCCHRRTL